MQQTTVPKSSPYQRFDPATRRRVRLQLMVMVVIILIGAILGAYLVAMGVLPNQYNLTLGETLQPVEVPDGFKITVFAMDLAAPRYIDIHNDVVFVSERGAGRVIALPDVNGDGMADKTVVVVDKLIAPTGLAFDGDWLYIAESTQVIRVRIGEDLIGQDQAVIIADLPGGKPANEVDAISHELTIYQNELYVSVGASCASCEETDSRRATVMVYNLDGSNERVFARGLYYTLGLAFNPITDQLWASNQGRPEFNNVPETLYILENGDDAGWNRCYAGSIIDPKYGDATACDAVKQPLLAFDGQANVTDILFLNNPELPETYQNDLLVILHGGVTEEETQIGMSILRLDIDPVTGEPLSDKLEAFADGWWQSEEPGDHVGRPFSMVLAPDGTLYITDDSAGAVYRLSNNF